MALTQILAMVRKDLQVYYSDRRSVIMSFVAPIAIASFLGAVTGGNGTPGEPAKIPIAVVDQDGSTVTKAIVSAVQDDKSLQELPIPDRLKWVPEDVRKAGASYDVGQMWVKFAEAIRTGKRIEPDFDSAVRRHRMLDAIRRASDTGEKQKVVL